MKNSLHYVKTKREKVGICNICGKEGKLSWDHVPPKGAIIYSNVEVLSVINNFIRIDNPNKEFYQNGMKFRTVCSSCNNLIGSKYDIVFNNFIFRLIDSIRENIGKAATFEICVDLELLIKSILGHMLAAKGEIENTLPDEKMREYLNGDKKFPEFNIHYWFYPFTINQVVRDIVVSKFSLKKNAMISILKLYPIAFLVTNDDMFLGMVPRLNDYFNYKNDNGSIIKFNLDLFNDYMWPIISDNDTILAGGQSINSSLMAVPRTIK